MKRLLAVCVLLSALVVGMAYAHGGHTDENGGHRDRSTGEYHYHHGYPAHYHTGGTCPYDFDDMTGWNSGSGGGVSSWWYTTAPRPTQQEVQNKNIHRGFDPDMIVPAVFGVGAVGVAGYVSYAVHKSRREQREWEEKREAERKQKIAFYKLNDLRTLSGMPDKYFVDDRNCPMERERSGFMYGESIDIYIADSQSSTVYHRKGCRYGKKLVNVFAADEKYKTLSRSPCAYCNPKPLPDGEWYREYSRHLRACKSLGVEPKREP